jgi:hypothetical protein
MPNVFLVVLTALSLSTLVACGDQPSSTGSSKMQPSPGAKGPGPVDRGGGKGEGSTVGESQNRDTKTGGATSGSK